jgi:hypothetical protein
MVRTGKVFARRYGAHILRTPTEVRNALGYVSRNFARHAAQWGLRIPASFVDPFSSLARADLVAMPATWLLREGWRRGPPPRDEPPRVG